MISLIWVMLVVIGIMYAGLTGRIEVITTQGLAAANQAVEMVLGLVGIICLWLGLMKIAEKSGLLDSVARLVAPVVRLLFPEIPAGHPAMGAMVMNIGGNLLGMGSAAIPFGLKAMAALQDLNKRKELASDAMCRFVILNTSGLTIIPASVIGLRASLGAREPAEIAASVFLATAGSTLAALTADRLLRKRSM